MPSASWYARNKEKAADDHRKWRNANLEYDKERKRIWYHKEGRKRDLKKLYGLTLEQYQALLVEQDFHCALCPETEKLCVDHNHETGVVRGILCYDCNRNFIGNHNSPDKFQLAAEYLRKKV